MEATAEAPRKTPEIRREGHSITVRKDDIPWLETPEYKVALVTMRHGSVEFLFGSAIQSKPLLDAARQLDGHRSEICNNLLYSHLPAYAEGFHPRISTVTNVRTRQPIFEIGNKGGQRVFFMRFGRIEGRPVIVKVAVCDKARENRVLSQITTESKKSIKQSARL